MNRMLNVASFAIVAVGASATLLGMGSLMAISTSNITSQQLGLGAVVGIFCLPLGIVFLVTGIIVRGFAIALDEINSSLHCIHDDLEKLIKTVSRG